jgi:outer membrane protein OmpA-like peptidoglycan-associated protein
LHKGNHRVAIITAIFSAAILFLALYTSSFELAISETKDAVGLQFDSVGIEQLAVSDDLNIFTPLPLLPSHPDRLRVTSIDRQAVHVVVNEQELTQALSLQKSPIKSIGAVLGKTVARVSEDVDDKPLPLMLDQVPEAQSAMLKTEAGPVDYFVAGSVIAETIESDEQVFLVRFGFDSAELDKNSLTTIQHAIDAIHDRLEGVAIIAGYSDPFGNTAYNLELSRKRAQAVADFLFALGVSHDRLRVEGRGAYADLDIKANEGPPELGRIAQIIIEESSDW